MNEVPTLEIRDRDGNMFRFAVAARTERYLNYLVTVDVGWAHASAEISTYLYGAPTKFFADLAQSWRGWSGEKKWEDLDHRIALTAVSDRTGHVNFKVILRELDALSRQVAGFFEAV